MVRVALLDSVNVRIGLGLRDFPYLLLHCPHSQRYEPAVRAWVRVRVTFSSVRFVRFRIRGFE